MYTFLFLYTFEAVTYHCILDLIFKYIVILKELLKFLCWTAYLWYVVFHYFVLLSA